MQTETLNTWYQVKWVRDNLDGYLNFYSVSGDGRVTNWTLVKNCLWHSDQLTISFARQLTNLAEAELGRWVFVSLASQDAQEVMYVSESVSQ